MIISEISEITSRIENIDGEEMYVLDQSMSTGMNNSRLPNMNDIGDFKLFTPGGN